MPTHNTTSDRPILPPLHYVLFLPCRGTYVRALDAERGRFSTTADRSQACTLPDSDARAAGLRVIRALDEPVELRGLTQ